MNLGLNLTHPKTSAPSQALIPSNSLLFTLKPSTLSQKVGHSAKSMLTRSSKICQQTEGMKEFEVCKLAIEVIHINVRPDFSIPKIRGGEEE